MKKKFYRDLRLGILGGGQLGRMLIQAAIDLNLYIKVLDPSSQAPCYALAHEFQCGMLTDYQTVLEFGMGCDLITIEIENVNTDALIELQALGKQVFPDPRTIKLIQNKIHQKEFYQKHHIPTSTFKVISSPSEIALSDLPLVQKRPTGGYDGQGVKVLKSQVDLEEAFEGESLLEAFVPFEKEIAVLTSRNAQGETSVFPTVEMVFHPQHNLVEYLFSPANLDPDIEKKAKDIAKNLVAKLDYVGLLAIEMFVTKNGEILVNEIAPRPHNSGHHTIRACATSQFEQHLRAILNLPLGDTRLLSPAGMVNLLGASGHSGPPNFEGLEKILAIPGAFPHIYGKQTTRPQRKMGHVIVLDQHIDALQEKIKNVRNYLSVKSE